MSVVLLVRHGQASFGDSDYDRLSPLGLAQSRRLGEVLGPRLPGSFMMLTGTHRRHIETAQSFLSAPRIEAPIRAVAGFDEFDHRELLGRAPSALDIDVLLAGAVARWTGGLFDAEYHEPWPTFRARCTAAVEDLTRTRGRASTTIVFTSAGPIAAICQRLLDLPDASVPRLMATLVNCGITKLVFGGSGLRLSTLNDHSHFEGESRALVSYR
jgi:broad specificity phosphatase PhoE